MKPPRNRKRRSQFAGLTAFAQQAGFCVQKFCNLLSLMVALVVCTYSLSIIVGATCTAFRMGYEAGVYVIEHLPHKPAPDTAKLFSPWLSRPAR